jgi:ribosome-associated protein
LNSVITRPGILPAPDFSAIPAPTPLTSNAQVIKTRLPNPPPPVDVLLRQVHAAVEELKARDTVEIDVRGKSSVCDYMVIASGTSTRHVKSIADEVVKFAKKLDVMPLGVEGEREAEWVLVDLGDVVVHVMLPRVREFYALERLWTVGDQPPEAEPAKADEAR